LNWPSVSAHGMVPAEGGSGLRAWTIAMDALARASVAAAAARGLHDLRAGSASSLAGAFADWVFVDLAGRDPARSVASAGRADPALTAQLARIPAQECPLIRSAMRRRRPVLAAQADIPVAESLGTLASGQPVASALRVGSVGAAPVLSPHISPEPIGAVTIARCVGSPDIGFLELGVLSQVADLAGVAASRLQPERAPSAGEV
jgi:GAF domain-containing protein